MSDDKVHSPAFWQYRRGKRLWEMGMPCPPKPADDCDWDDAGLNLWVGWRAGAMMDWMERRDVARKLNMPDPDFNPPYKPSP